MRREDTKRKAQLSFLAPEEVEKDAAREELLKIIKENLALARDIAALYGHPRVEGRGKRIKSPADVAELLTFEMGSLDQEQMRVVVLSTRNEVLSIEMVYQGSLNATLVRMAELFKEAVRRNGAAIVLAHNHPSGVVEPSPEDLKLTRQAIEAGELLGIDVLDHLVIGQGGRYYSIKRDCGEVWDQEVEMELVTEELREKLPPLYATEDQKDPLVVCKFFHPRSAWTWYAIEFDGEDLFFGLVEGHFTELGYFSLRELEGFQDDWGLGIERDIHFEPRRLSEIRDDWPGAKGDGEPDNGLGK